MVLGYNRVRYTDTFLSRFDDVAESVVHFEAPWGGMCCGHINGPNREDAEWDDPVTCSLCIENAWRTYRWWFPRKALPDWLAEDAAVLGLK
jgi:hypothetical protein